MNPFEAENLFYLHSAPSRVAKFLAHAKLYEMSLSVPGHFVEVGVFRGASFARFRKLGKILHPDHLRRFVGFDTFGSFPKTDYGPDKPYLKDQIETDGGDSISRENLLALLDQQDLADNVELIEGDVRETMPAFLEANGEVSFAFVNIDIDLYEGTEAAVRLLFPRVSRGGIILLDDYEGFPGAKKAIDDFIAREERPEVIRKFPFAASPCYIVKE